MTATEHAEAILKAAGSSLRHYTMPATRTAILAAVEAAMRDARVDAIDEAVAIAERWRDENMASAARARKSRSEGALNTADMVEGAAIECNAIAGALRALAHKGAGDE